MENKKRILIFTMIFSLLFVNISYCANGSSSDPFYVQVQNNSNTVIGQIYTMTGNINSALRNLIYNPISEINTLCNSLLGVSQNKPSISTFNIENYILREQDSLQDIFIIMCEHNSTLKDYIKTHLNFNVYAYVYPNDPQNVVFAIYTSNIVGNSYQSNPSWNFYHHYQGWITNSESSYYVDYLVNGTKVSGPGRITYNKNSNDFVVQLNYNYTDFPIPMCCLGYQSTTLTNYLNSVRGADSTTNAINDNTQAIKDSTDRILSEQSDTITDTGVTDTSTDASPNLQTTFNTMSGAFTTRNTSTKTFVFTLPNGQTYNFTLANNLLTNMLSGYGSTFYAFYQAIFWCAFGGYVLFDFKRIINKFKGGDIDSVVSSSSPIDNVVKASLS